VTDDDDLYEFVRAWQPMLNRIAYLLTGDHDAAMDLVQTTLVKVVTNWDRVIAADRPEVYARRIIYHEHVSWWRHRNRTPERLMGEVPDVAGRHDMSETVVRQLVLQHAMRQLSPRQRAVLVLRFFEDLPEADVAQVLGCSVGTVKSQTHDALRRLRVIAPELGDNAAGVNETVEVAP
jgi:RNA polymerase sigma-70 factor (sigma-E family)